MVFVVFVLLVAGDFNLRFARDAPAAFTSSLNTSTFSVFSTFSSLSSSTCRDSVREFAADLLCDFREEAADVERIAGNENDVGGGDGVGVGG